MISCSRRIRSASRAADARTNVVSFTPDSSAARKMRSLSLGLTRISMLSVAFSPEGVSISLKFNTLPSPVFVPTM